MESIDIEISARPLRDPLTETELLRLPKIISLCNLKGGAGKTVFAAHLAMVLARKGLDVVVLDCDNEGSSKSLQREAEMNEPLPFEVEVGLLDGFKRRAKQLTEEGKVVLIDTPPNSREFMMGAAMLSDLVIVPVKCSEFDLDRLGGVLEMMEDLKAAKETLSYRIVLNEYTGFKLAREIDQALNSLPRFQTKVKLREHYRRFRDVSRAENLLPFRSLVEEMVTL